MKLLLIVLVSVATFAIFDWIQRRWARWSVRRLVAKVQRDREMGRQAPVRLVPESRYVVQLSDAAVSCTHPDGEVERVEWDDLRRVEIMTTDQGPFLPDVFWVLHGSEAGCLIPHGATGEDELRDRLGKLSGFRHEAVIDAMCSVENRRFLCWERISVG